MSTTEPIEFEVVLMHVKDRAILRLPEEQSAMLPSRGPVAVRGTLNGQALRTVLEADGYKGHWMRVDAGLLEATGIRGGDRAQLRLEVASDWPEPEVPDDFAEALSNAPQKVRDRWADITPMARWEWVRWVSATANMGTRAVRIEKSISKLSGTHRRPCCFNWTACTDPDLSKSGRLIDAADPI